MGSKKLQLSTSIQASFGNPDDPDYVFDIAANGNKSVMAVSLSTNVIKLYNPETGAFMGDLLGHTSSISCLDFPDLNSSHLLFSSSTDATVRTWDIRVGKQVSGMPTLILKVGMKVAVFKSPGLSDEVWSFSVGGSPANMIAGGGNAQVLLWDWRRKELVATWDEWHTEAVTKVQFHPSKKEQLLTASVDGLINVLNTKASFDSEDALESTLSLGTSLSKFGFFGKDSEMLWVLTHIETLSIWNLEGQFEAAVFGDTRSKASYSWSLPSVNYMIDCHSPQGTSTLWLTAGNNDGAVGYFPVSYAKASDSSTPSVGVIGEVGAVLEGGHQGVVRTAWLNESISSEQPMFCWTGGEDGRLCSWSQNSCTERGQAWVSSNLVMRRGATSKQRLNPY